jgi:sulfoxide reductase heme-binding subunit YedZ
MGARPAPRRGTPLPWLSPGIFIGALAPLASIVIRAFTGGLTADPIAEIENELGLTALIFLISSLACTPARRLLGWTWPTRIRRQLGLWAFTYAVLHFLMYLVVDQGFDWATILGDIAERPFITVGFLALVLMEPLALTSTNDSVRKLGFRRWTRLHQLAYVAGALAVVHFIWRVKADISQPLMYAIVLGSLLAARLGWWVWQRQAAATAPPASRKPVARRLTD